MSIFRHFLPVTLITVVLGFGIPAAGAANELPLPEGEYLLIRAAQAPRMDWSRDSPIAVWEVSISYDEDKDEWTIKLHDENPTQASLHVSDRSGLTYLAITMVFSGATKFTLPDNQGWPGAWTVEAFTGQEKANRTIDEPWSCNGRWVAQNSSTQHTGYFRLIPKRP